MADEPTDGDAKLESLRSQIDALDARIVELLNARASVVVEVGSLKRAEDRPIYAPDREAKVLARVLGRNEGPLGDRAVEGVYRELMSGSFALERPLRIGYLGPRGSFSHQAATSYFGSSVAYEDLHEIGGVFAEVGRGHVDYGLVPIENSIGGGIVESLEAFMARTPNVRVYAEALVRIRHNLLSNGQPSEVRRIYSKPEVFAQCRNWVRQQYPGAQLVPAPSSSQAVVMAREAWERDPSCGAAAIGSRLAGQLYGVSILFESVEDRPENLTRFYVLAREQAPPSGDDKTAIMFSTDDAPGALLRVLTAFAEAGVNLSHIDKRPSGQENWTYTFFVDAVGHRSDPTLKGALVLARQHCRELEVLGSFPRAKRVL